MSTPRAFIFDLDDTLLDRSAMVAAFAHRYLHRYLPELSGPDYDRAYRAFLQVDDSGLTRRPTLFPIFYGELGIDGYPPLKELDDYWNEHFADEVAIVPGAVDTLLSLKADNRLLGMVTNGNSVLQNSKIDHTGFRELFDNIIVSGDFGVHKPDPRIFCASLEALGTRAADAVYIGDNPVNDIDGAHSAGIRAVWANYFGYTNEGHGPDYEIHAVTELLSLEFV